MAEREPNAMDCWLFIAPLMPLSDDYWMKVYVKTFHAFKLLEAEEKKNKGAEQEG